MCRIANGKNHIFGVPALLGYVCQVLTFFSTEDRVHKLQSTKLRDILDSVGLRMAFPKKGWGGVEGGI